MISEKLLSDGPSCVSPYAGSLHTPTLRLSVPNEIHDLLAHCPCLSEVGEKALVTDSDMATGGLNRRVSRSTMDCGV